jgi:hypothetical protein
MTPNLLVRKLERLTGEAEALAVDTEHFGGALPANVLEQGMGFLRRLVPADTIAYINDSLSSSRISSLRRSRTPRHDDATPFPLRPVIRR